MFVYTIVPKSAPVQPVLLQQPKRARPTPSSGLGAVFPVRFSLMRFQLHRLRVSQEPPRGGHRPLPPRTPTWCAGRTRDTVPRQPSSHPMLTAFG
eukprot:1078323-Prymnesium_polylepis.1